MKILLTGAFGTIGCATLPFLCGHGYSMRCLDLPGSRNKQLARKIAREFPVEIMWGDVTSAQDIATALQGVDLVIHLAASIAPASERHPEKAHAVNVEGTRLLLAEAGRMSTAPRLIYASSYTTYGPTAAGAALRQTGDPQKAVNHYTSHKLQAEAMVLESALDWTIVRFSLVMDPARIAQFDPEMFEIPLEQPIELLHPKDAGRALAALAGKKIPRQIFLLGGGAGWQMRYRDMLGAFMPLFGLQLPPESAFRVPDGPNDWYYTCWLDTEASQRILQFQTIGFEEFLSECRQKNRWLRLLSRPLKGLIMPVLERLSPYYAQKSKKHEA